MNFYKKNLNCLILLAIVLAPIFSYLYPNFFIKFNLIGFLFLNALKVIIIPVIVIAISYSFLSISNTLNLGAVARKTFIFYIITTAIAILTALFFVNIINPGLDANITGQKHIGNHPELSQILYNFVPENIFRALLNNNILGILIITIIFSISIIKTNNADKFINTIKALFESILWIVDFIMYFAPIGIFFLLSKLFAENYINKTYSNMGEHLIHYFLTVISSLFFHALISLPIILLIFKINPIKLMKNVFPGILIAFSTASSMASLSTTIDLLVRKAKLKKSIVNFVSPFGATVNMDGTAIYEAVAVIFIANVYGIDLSMAQQCIVFFLTLVTAIGVSGTPGASLAMLILILNYFNIPAEGISIIIITDRLLDMFRTSINVWGDCCASAVISKSESKLESKNNKI